MLALQCHSCALRDWLLGSLSFQMTNLKAVLRAITKPLDDCFCCTDGIEVRGTTRLLCKEGRGPST